MIRYAKTGLITEDSNGRVFPHEVERVLGAPRNGDRAGARVNHRTAAARLKKISGTHMSPYRKVKSSPRATQWAELLDHVLEEKGIVSKRKRQIEARRFFEALALGLADLAHWLESEMKEGRAVSVPRFTIVLEPKRTHSGA